MEKKNATSASIYMLVTTWLQSIWLQHMSEVTDPQWSKITVGRKLSVDILSFCGRGGSMGTSLVILNDC